MSHQRSYRVRLVVFLGCLGLLFSLGWAATDIQANEARWYTDLGAAKQLSVKSNRPILLHFWAPWCGPCKYMERTTFVDPNVARLLSEHYIPVKLNIDHPTSQRIAAQYGLKMLVPSDVIVAPNGQILWRSSKPMDAQNYTAVLTRAAEAIQTPHVAQVPKNATVLPVQPVTGRAIQPQPQNQPRPSKTPIPSQPTGFTPGSTTPYRPGGNVTQPQTQPQPQVQPQPQDQSRALNRNYAPYGHYAANASRPNPAIQPKNTPPRQGSYGATVPSYPAFASPQPSLNQTPQPKQEPKQEIPAIARQSTRLPESKPQSFGLEGYCPVELVNNKRWVPGNLKHGAVHEGVTYIFAGPGQQRMFLEHPERYAPANRGCDIILSTETGQNIPGKRQHGVFVVDTDTKKHTVYLFANEATLKKFQGQIDAADRQAKAAASARQHPAQNPATPAQPASEQAKKTPWWYR